MSENGKTWLRLRWRTMFLLAICAAVGWSTYSYWSEYSARAARKAREMMAPSAGAGCTVIFRTKELGFETNPLTATQNSGVPNFVTGRFVKLNDDWIVLKTSEDRQLWIPRSHVLLMRVEP